VELKFCMGVQKEGMGVEEEFVNLCLEMTLKDEFFLHLHRILNSKITFIRMIKKGMYFRKYKPNRVALGLKKINVNWIGWHLVYKLQMALGLKKINVNWIGWHLVYKLQMALGLKKINVNWIGWHLVYKLQMALGLKKINVNWIGWHLVYKLQTGWEIGEWNQVYNL